MIIRKHYCTLRQAFSSIPEGQAVTTTTSELAEIIGCTPRNMMLLLKRMQDLGWIEWITRRGRGKRSELTFLVSAEQMAIEEAQEYIDKKNLPAALHILRETAGQANATPHLQEQFQSWLMGQFGFHSEAHGTTRLDVLRFPLPQRISSIDPAAIQFSGESHLVNQLFDGLVRMDIRGGDIMPHIAHTWETDKARRCWTFYLRKGVLFHNGRELRSNDVKYSLLRLQRLAPHGLFSQFYQSITHIVTPDETTITFHLNKPNELFLTFLTTSRAVIVPPEADDTAFAPIGSGPFRYKEHQDGIWILEAFKHYFQGRAFLDRVEVWTDTQLSQPQQELRQDNAHNATPAFLVMHNARVSDQIARDWQSVRQLGTTCKFITINESRLQDAQLRHQLQKLVQTHLPTFMTDETAHTYSSFWDTELRQDREENPLANLPRQQLTLATIFAYANDAELIRQLCAAHQIDLHVTLLTTEQFQSSQRLDADLMLFAIMLDEHRELRLVDLLGSMQQHVQPQVRQIIESQLAAVRSQTDIALRQQLLQSLEQILIDRHTLVHLYRRHLHTAYHSSVRGVDLASLGWVRFRDLWFTRS